MEFIKLWKRRKVIFRIFHRCLYMNIKNTILFFFFISRLSSASHVWVCVLWCVVVCATSKKNKRQQEKREERKKNKLKLVYSEFVCRRQRRQRRLLRRIGGKARWLLFVSAYCYIYAESVRKRNKIFFFVHFIGVYGLFVSNETFSFYSLPLSVVRCAAVTTALLQTHSKMADLRFNQHSHDEKIIIKIVPNAIFIFVQVKFNTLTVCEAQYLILIFVILFFFYSVSFMQIAYGARKQ